MELGKFYGNTMNQYIINMNHSQSNRVHLRLRKSVFRMNYSWKLGFTRLNSCQPQAASKSLSLSPSPDSISCKLGKKIGSLNASWSPWHALPLCHSPVQRPDNGNRRALCLGTLWGTHSFTPYVFPKHPNAMISGSHLVTDRLLNKDRHLTNNSSHKHALNQWDARFRWISCHWVVDSIDLSSKKSLHLSVVNHFTEGRHLPFSTCFCLSIPEH